MSEKVRDNKGLCGMWWDDVAEYVFEKVENRETKSVTK